MDAAMMAMPQDDARESAQDADAYDRWFRAKVQAALDDTRPRLSPEQVERALKAKIAGIRERTVRAIPA
jgi:hypothetical protein